MRRTFLILFFSIILSSPLFSEKVWVFFCDKGFQKGSSDEIESLEKARKRLSPRCLERRAKTREKDNLVDYHDIDIYGDYIDAIIEAGAKISIKSRWFNAVSVVAEPDIIEKISDFPFVERIAPVRAFHKIEIFDSFAPSIEDWHYGASYTQNAMLGTILPHSLGLDGNGVLICMTDTGFMLRHDAFTFTDVLGRWDFVSGDSIVSYEPGDPLPSESHGTKTWSAVGGFYPGQIVGTAFGASFLLARTENYYEEYPIEEDWWISAVEWADSFGVDIVSTSLGYSDWYTPDSMNGDIAHISVAADRMAEIGILTVTAVGNNGYLGPISITAPGDADSVIAVGAIGFDGTIASFSSRGPTFDGRIKPELCAPGVGVWSASSSASNSYGGGSGTSLSTPLVSGLSAIMLQARPELLPMDVREALMMTANRSTRPDNSYGYGIPNVSHALCYPIRGGCGVFLRSGWNLVSIPLEGPLDPETAFHGHIGDVYGWDSDSLVEIGIGGVFPGKAYFVLCDRDIFSVVRGTPATARSLSTSGGWLAIGCVRRALDLNDIARISSATLYPLAFEFDPRKSNYLETKRLVPGKGYFILVLSAGEVNIPE